MLQPLVTHASPAETALMSINALARLKHPHQLTPNHSRRPEPFGISLISAKTGPETSDVLSQVPPIEEPKSEDESAA